VGELLYIEEVAKRFRVTRKTVYDWMREGKLRYVVVGGRRRIPEEAIVEFVKDPNNRPSGDSEGFEGNQIPDPVDLAA
jgi:excisionase family DNA binding protein